MEQYEIAKEILFDDINYCIQKYKLGRIFIRLVGSKGGTTKVKEELENKILNIEQTLEGLSFLIDQKEIFVFKQGKPFPDSDNDDWGKNFSLAYERYPDKTGVIPMLSTGINPNDPNLPPVNTSHFRCANYDHF